MEMIADVQGNQVSFEVSKGLYSLQGIQIAAVVFSSKADVLLGSGGKTYGLELRPRRPGSKKEELEALGGEFLNELLNQEYRMLVGKFNRKVSDLVLTQALFSARGGENPPGPPKEEETPEFKAGVDELLRETEEDIRRTMPKKIPPQGNPIPPQKEPRV